MDRRELLKNIGKTGAGIGTLSWAASRPTEASHTIDTLDVSSAPEGDYWLPGMLHRRRYGIINQYGWRVTGELEEGTGPKRLEISLMSGPRRVKREEVFVREGFTRTLWTWRRNIRKIEIVEVR